MGAPYCWSAPLFQLADISVVSGRTAPVARLCTCTSPSNTTQATVASLETRIA